MPNKLESLNPETRSLAKESITVHLPADIIEKTEDIVFHLRKQLSRENRKKLNRSKIYELVLQNIFAEYSANGQKGWLGRIVIEWDETIGKQ